MSTVYVVCRDWGYEGHEPPEIGFLTEAEALAYIVSMKGATTAALKVYPVVVRGFAPISPPLPTTTESRSVERRMAILGADPEKGRKG